MKKGETLCLVPTAMQKNKKPTHKDKDIDLA